MATILLSDLGDLLKKVIQPIIQDQLFRETILLNKLQKNKGITMNNGTFYITAKTAEHSGVYNVPEGGSINDGKFSTAQMNAKSKYAYGRHTFTDQAIEALDGNPDALVNILTEASDELKNSMARDMQRQFYSFGQGVLATVNGAVTGTTITVNGPAQKKLGTQFIYPGQKLQIGTKAQIEWGTADAVTVVDVPTETTFTVSASVTVADADLIVKDQAYDLTNSVYTDMNGIMGLIDNNSSPVWSTLQGLSRSTKGFLNAPVYKPGSDEVLTISRMEEYYLKARKFGNPDIVLSNSDLYAKYSSLLEASKRQVNTMDLSGGFTALEFAAGSKAIGVALDYDCDPTNMHILDTQSLSIGEMAPLSFLDTDGQIIRNIGGNSANFSAIMKFYGELIVLRPKANARLTRMIPA